MAGPERQRFGRAVQSQSHHCPNAESHVRSCKCRPPAEAVIRYADPACIDWKSGSALLQQCREKKVKARDAIGIQPW